MSATSFRLYLGAVLLLVCLCNLVPAEQSILSRQRRGFRQDAATRVAHGYGKRGDLFVSRDRLSRFPLIPSEVNPRFVEDVNDGSSLSAEELEDVLASNPSIARFLLKKYINDVAVKRLDWQEATVADDLASSQQLSKSLIKK